MALPNPPTTPDASKLHYLMYDNAATNTASIWHGVHVETLNAETIGWAAVATHEDGDADAAGQPVVLVAGSSGTNILPVAIDSSGNLQVDIVSGGATEVQYTEGDIDATITGTAILWEGAGNTLTAISASTPLPVILAANSGVDVGDVDVLSVTPGVGATNLGKAIDSVAGATDVGVAILAVRDDVLSALTPIEGDYVPLRVNSEGALHVVSSGSGEIQYTEGDVDATITGTAVMWEDAGNVLRAVSATNRLPINPDGHIDHNIFPAGGTTFPMGGFCDETPGIALNEGDVGVVRCSPTRSLYVNIRDGAGNERGLNVDAQNNIGVVIKDSAGDSAMDDANNAVRVNVVAGGASGGTSATDDAAFTAGSGAGTPMMGFATSDVVDAGDVGVVGMTVNRALFTTLRDGAGDSVMDDANNAVRVNIVAGAGSGGTAMADDSAFTPATTQGTPAFAMFDDVTPDSVDEGDAGILRMSANRNLYTNIRDASGSERGANVNASNELLVKDTDTEAAIIETHSQPAAAPPTFGVAVGGSDGSSFRMIRLDSTGRVQAIIHDGTNAATVRNLASNDALNVAIVDNAGGQVVSFGTSIADDSAFSAGVTDITPVGGVYAATRDSVDSGDAGAFAMSQRRAILTGDDIVQSSANSTTTPLGISGTFTGSWESVVEYDSIVVTVNADQDGTLFVDFSNNAGTTTSYTHSQAFSAGVTPQVFHVPRAGTSVRIRYTNGAVAQATFVLQALYSTGNTGTWVDNFTWGQRLEAIELATEATQTATAGIFNNAVWFPGDAWTVNDGGITSVVVRKDTRGNLDASIADGDYTVLQVTSNGDLRVRDDDVNTVLSDVHDDPNNAIRVNIVAGAGSGGTSATDDAAFTAGTGSGTPIMGFATTDVVDSGDVGVVAMSTQRSLHVELFNGATGPLGTVTNPLRTFQTTTEAINLVSVAGNSVNAHDSNTDGHSSLLTGMVVQAKLELYNGTTYDRARGDITNGLDVDVTRLPSLPAGTNNIGDVDVLSVVPGTGATNLGKAEDAAHASGDVGVAPLGVRGDISSSGTSARTAFSGTDGDYTPIAVTGAGAVRTVGDRGAVSTQINAVTFDNTTTSSNGSAIDISDFDRFALTLAWTSATGGTRSTSINCRVQVQFSNDNGTTWFTFAESPFSAFYQSQASIGSGGINECITGRVAARQMRILVTSTGTTAAETITLTAKVEPYRGS